MKRRFLFLLAGSCFTLNTTIHAQDSLAAARDLYASAAYEEALDVLNRLTPAQGTPDDARTADEYRAFCLLALGRTNEAQHAIEALVAEQPAFHPADADMSPRVRAAFSDVRRRMLPTVIQQRYADAKAAFVMKEFSAASQGFQQVLDLMRDPDVGSAAAQPPLADIRTLATGFHDLSAQAIPPPPLPSAPAVRAPEPPAVVQPVPAAPVAPRVYSGADAIVIPPVTLHQELPSFPGQALIPRQGMMEIVIDENGAVETAVMRQPVTPSYDALALNAAKTWRYRPASVNGAPVKYRKVVQITVKAQGRS